MPTLIEKIKRKIKKKKPRKKRKKRFYARKEIAFLDILKSRSSQLAELIWPSVQYIPYKDTHSLQSVYRSLYKPLYLYNNAARVRSTIFNSQTGTNE